MQAKFRGELGIFSNFFPYPITYKGKRYATSEHAFQAEKMLNPEDAEKVRLADTPAKTKKLGNELPMRPDWNNVRVEVMLDILRVKFAPGSKNAIKLINTPESDLIEYNCWHDNFWGICTCDRCAHKQGKNMLGELLKKIRAEYLQNEAVV